MALIRKWFASGASADFAAEVGTALEVLDIFDDVTTSGTTITCAKDSQTVLVLTLGARDGTPFIEFYNESGTKILSRTPGIPNTSGNYGLAKDASYSTDGHFIHLILTSDVSATGGTCIRSSFIFIGKTKSGGIGLACSFRRSATAWDIYPQNEFSVVTNAAASEDTSISLAAPRSDSAPYLNSYDITVPLAGATIDTFDNVWGILFSPSLFSLTFGVFGMLPTALTIGDKKYITDGVLLMEYDDTEVQS